MALARLVAPRFAHTLFASLRHTDAHGRTFYRPFAAQIDVERRSPCFSHARAFASMDQIAKNGVEDPAIHQRTILFVRETSVSPPKSRHHSPSLSITRSIHRESTFFCARIGASFIPKRREHPHFKRSHSKNQAVSDKLVRHRLRYMGQCN